MSELTLPYHFDTRQQTRIITGALLAGAVIILVAGLAAPWYMPDDPETAALLQLIMPLAALTNLPMSVLLFKQSRAAAGTIAPHMITVQAARFFGFSSGAPSGTFAPGQFSAVRIKIQSSKHTRLYRPELVGQAGLANLPLQAMNDKQAAEHFAEQLATRLGLPFERLPS
jgi:hypothetical protein